MRSRIKQMPLGCHWLKPAEVRCGIQWHAAVVAVRAHR